MWAKHPEIARRWSTTYGSGLDALAKPKVKRKRKRKGPDA